MENQKKHDETVRCKGCPYPLTGFLCGGSDGECMKTRVQKIRNMASGGVSKNGCD